MLKYHTVHRLSECIGELLPPQLQQVKEDFDERLKLLLQEQLSNLEFVSREEFDLQTRVLQRTRSQLEALESKLSVLEQAINR